MVHDELLFSNYDGGLEDSLDSMDSFYDSGFSLSSEDSSPDSPLSHMSPDDILDNFIDCDPTVVQLGSESNDLIDHPPLSPLEQAAQ